MLRSIYPKSVEGLCQFGAKVLLGYTLVASASAAADDGAHGSYRGLAEMANCSFYRAKKRDVPVYRDADTASEVVDRLQLGEEVCYIGERGAFAIVDWSKQPLIRGGEKRSSPQGVLEQGFVRLVDVWPPRDASGTGWGISDWWMRYGGAMDDPLGGLRGEPK